MICLSAGRVSATLWIRSLDDSLSQTSQVIRRRSGQQPDTSTSNLTRARVAARGEIFLVDFRNISGTLDDFHETWPEAGNADMVATMQDLTVR